MSDNDDKEDKITKLVKEGKLPVDASKRKQFAANKNTETSELQKQINSLSTKYGSIAGMAIDLFKHFIQDPDYKDYSHSKLIKISYDVAEEFQEEMDNRYNYELFKLSRISAKELADVEAAEPIVRGPDEKSVN